MLDKDQKKMMKFQTEIMKMQMNQEDRYCELASLENLNKTSVIICHRGVLDGYAYIEENIWDAVLEQNGLNIN